MPRGMFLALSLSMTQTAVTSRPLTVEPTTSKTIADPTSWREAAVLVLVRSGQPLRAAQIVTHATQWGLAPSSGTRTPAQSINRDLHAAMRNGDQRVEVGPRPGQFLAVTDPQHHVAGDVPVAHRPARGPRLPMEALQAAVDARGGLGACGLGGRAPSSESDTTHAKESQRLARATER
jgi:hypothetical protein